jgi:hypothetical protein
MLHPIRRRLCVSRRSDDTANIAASSSSFKEMQDILSGTCNQCVFIFFFDFRSYFPEARSLVALYRLFRCALSATIPFFAGS